MNKLKVNVRTSELDGLSDALVAKFKSDGAAQGDAFLASLFAKIEPLSAQITEAIKRDRVSTSLEDADAARDGRLRALGNLLAGYESIPLEQMRAAAEFLKAIFDKYGAKVALESYDSESSLLESLLGDFETPDAAKNVEVLAGVAEAVAALRKAQADFLQAKVSLGTVAANKKEQISASSLRKPLLSLINDRLVPYLKLNEAESLAEFARFAELQIDGANRTIAARMKKGEKAAEDA